MTNWDKESEFLKKLYISSFVLPTEIFNELKTQIYNNKKIENLNTSGLAGHIKEEYSLNISENMNRYFSWCSSQKPVIDKISKDQYLTNDVPIVCNELWVNFQKKYEFNPIHNHSGFASFICFIKIPYDLEEEEKVFSIDNKVAQTHTSKLSFVFTNEAGEVVSYCVNVDKSFEGKMLMFVSKQHHMVYPFYTSDNYRITVSGNLRYEVKNA